MPNYPNTVPVIIGAGYGDEGKGLLTSHITKTLNGNLVCKFNGGAQAGHTVVKNNDHAIFHQYGSGTFEGANTYLSSDFIFNPLLVTVEKTHLNNLKYFPKLYVNKDARVTTIFDMAINQIAELNRDKKHGSCGIGINETVTRDDFVSIRVSDLLNEDILTDKIEKVFTEWVPQRLMSLGITLNDYFHAKTFNVLLNANFRLHAIEMRKVLPHIEVDQPEFTQLICEGAQGLALDEFLGEFPHVTRSVTGLPNAIKAVQNFSGNSIQPIYVTRSYTTRHGAGSLAYENEFIANKVPVDLTNVPNIWQNTLRYAPLNLKLLNDLISKDMTRSANSKIMIQNPVLAITHLDFINEEHISVYDINGNSNSIKGLESFVEFVENQINIPVRYVGMGVDKVLGLC